jgi:GntR family transcriptional regulator/MocR family aminotransferase
LFVPLDPALHAPLYEQIAQGVRQAILAGRLARGTRVPSSRAWAEALGVSRFTIVSAVEALAAEGYLVGRRGAGTFVAHALPERRMVAPGEGRRRPSAIVAAVGPAPGLSGRGVALSAVVITGPRRDRDEPRAFRPRRPPLDIFPVALWMRTVRRQWNADRYRYLDYGDPAGYRPLREAIARHVSATRGVRCSGDQVVVTSGSQQAFDLLFRLLLDPGDAAWIEEPGYLDVRAALTGAGARLVPVPVDAEGLDVDEGLRRAPTARLAIVSPSHQYPTGATLSAARRVRLLNWARRVGAWIVEDDYDSYFRYRGRPMPALQTMDRDAPGGSSTAARVIYVGTFSKTMFPSLRLGYTVVPDTLVDAVANARAVADRNSPIVDQAALADFIDEGHYDRHLRRVRRVCEERHDAMHAQFRRRFGGTATLSRAAAGTHVLATFAADRRRPAGRKSFAAAVARAATDADLVVFRLSRYCLEPPGTDALVLGYGGLTPARIAAGMDALARCVARVRRRGRPSA